MKQESRIERDFTGVGTKRRKQRIQTRCVSTGGRRRGQAGKAAAAWQRGLQMRLWPAHPFSLHLGEPAPHLVATDPPSAFQGVVESI